MERRSIICAVVIALGVAALAGCGQMPPVATVADAERAHVELADLHQGRKLLIRKCGNCHRPPLPAEHAPDVWPGKLDEMVVRSNLNAAQRAAIQQYLVTIAGRPAPVARK